MKAFFLGFFLASLSVTAQDSIKIPYSTHKIYAPDSISAKTVKEFVYYMDYQPVYYERAILKVKGIKIITRDRLFVSDFKDGYIILNERLNEFPWCKKAAIMQELYKNTGGKVEKDPRTLVHYAFRVNEHTNEKFKRQFEDEYMLRLMVRKLRTD